MNQPSGSMAKPSRYRQAREDSTTVDDMNRPATSSTASDTNPTIARSMSRYRRRRPGAESSPAIPGAALATSRVAVPASRHARHQSDAEEEHLREKHRLDAMDQLTGGNPKSRPSTRPPSIEKSARRSLTTENGTSTVQSRETTQECRAKPDPSTDPADRKSFFQKVGLGKPKGASAKDQASPRYIGVGGGGIVPGTDAPVSAVNAGKRHVLVQYGNVSLWFPFTPSTRASDILRSASKTLSSEINPDTFILVETFRQIGLDRPLRRYEHIREIMNSWSQDADGNRLTVIPPSSMDIYARLDAQHVPLERPGETTVLMYYSHRPRRWDKRFVTLRTDGQVTMAKKETSKDSTNICHLSDYDIYTPQCPSSRQRH
ncbi:hypothetical protein N7470_006402 [Penicillium chermesinum]|nr:hypothetical protein N7470_006402 [Penicillium chermesinum]